MKEIVPYIIGGGIMFAFIVVLAYFGKRRVKSGKADDHWRDY
jgi:hypothetical protein